MKLLPVIAILFLTSCKTYIKPISVTADKKNGIVNLTYSLQSAPFEYVVNPQQEINTAKKKCIELGYKTTEPVRKTASKCFIDGYCQTKEVVNSYKCLNK